MACRITWMFLSIISRDKTISLARNKAEADNNEKDYNGITILYLMGGMTDMTNKLEEINKQ